MAQNYYIPRRPEVRPPPFRFQNTNQSPTVSGFRGAQPPPQPSSVIYSSPVTPLSPPPLPSGLAKSPVLERYPPAAQPQYAKNEPMRRHGIGPPPASSAYYREDQTGRNFQTLPISRTQSRTPLPLSPNPTTGSSRTAPNSPLPPPSSSQAYYRTYSHSPFGNARRAPPVLDTYPSLLTLNDVKLTPLPGQRPGRYSTSIIPTVLDRYPPAAADGGYYTKPSNRNSAPVLSSQQPVVVPPSPGPRKKQNSVDDNFVPNRFRYPTSPGRTPPPSSPRLEFRQSNFDYSSPMSSRMASPVQTPSPPPPPPIVVPVKIKNSVPAPPPPKRHPSNASTLVRKPSVKVKRSSSTASVTNGRVHPPQQQQQQQQGSTRRRLPPQNQPSRLLNDDENNFVFQILGTGRQSLSTAIVQLLLPSMDHEFEERWKLREVTVLCFVRDPSRKSYFLEFLSLRLGHCIYSCEIYEEFDYRTVKNTRFITFEGQESRVGVNFADDEEFFAFKDTLDKKIEARRQRRYDRQSKAMDLPNGNKEDGQPNSKLLGVPKDSNKKSKFTLRRFSNSKTKKDKKSKKLDKRDIGTPSNFKHVSHAGFDPQHGFQSYGDIDIAKYQEVFEKAQISQRELNDPETRKFIYEFVENYEKKAAPAPPIPPVQKMAPPPPHVANHRVPAPATPSPPPPPRMNLPRNNVEIHPPDEPEPDYNSQTSRSPPPPPPPSSRNENRPPPPPAPPLPAAVTGHSPPPPPPPPMPTENSLPTSQNQRPVHVPTTPEGDARSNLMKEIQEAAKGKLKHVDHSVSQESNSPKSMAGMAGALQRALAERSRAINPDSSESESDDGAFDSEEWEDD